MKIVVELEARTGTFDTDWARTAKRAEREIKKLEAESKKALGGVQKSFNDTGSRIKGFVAGFLTVGAIVGVFRSVVKATAESEKASQALESALRGTRGATAETANQLKAYAEELQRTTIFEDDAIVSGQALLATFRNLSADAIPRATRLALDLAAAYGKDLRSSFELVGKVANDPIKGIRALREAHVSLSPAQQKTIKELTETGRIAEAQALSFTELERVVGGRAVDATKTLSGALLQLKNAFGNLLEGESVEDATASINKLTEVLQSPETKRAFATFTSFLLDTAATAVKFGTDVINAVTDVNRIQIIGEEKFRGIPFLDKVLRNLPGPLGHVSRGFDSVTDSAVKTIQQIDNLSPKLIKVIAQANAAQASASGLFKGTIQRPSQAAPPQGEGLITGAITPQFLSDAQLRAAEKARQEARRLQEAIAQGEAEIFQAGLDRQRQALEADLDLRQISYKDYLAEKLRLTEDEINAEIAASEALLQGAERDEAAILKARIQTLEIQREIARESKTQDEARHARELADAYEDAARAAQSYVDEISRAGQRELLLLDLKPSDRRFAQGQFQIEDRFRSDVEQLDTLGLEQEEYDKRLSALQGFYAQATDEHRKYFEAIEAKQKDFTTGFNNAINEYIDATQNVGAVLGETLVHALDDATHAASRAAAEFILFGESPREAIYQLARSISTQLLQALIQVGIQALLTKTLLAAIGGGVPQPGSANFIGPLQGRASGGYAGDIDRNKVAGVYHGGEFIINADATRKNRGLLEAINSGTFSGDAASVPSSSGQGFKPETNVRVINVPDKSYIKDYLMGEEGDEVFVNWVGRNGSRIKQAVAS